VKLVALVRLRHRGESVAVGAEFEAPDGEGQALVKRCWAEPCAAPKKAKRKVKESAPAAED